MKKLAFFILLSLVTLGVSAQSNLKWNVNAGYLFGGLEVVQRNLKLLIVLIIFISLVPMAVEIWRNKRKAKKTGAKAGE